MRVVSVLLTAKLHAILNHLYKDLVYCTIWVLSIKYPNGSDDTSIDTWHDYIHLLFSSRLVKNYFYENITSWYCTLHIN